MSELHQISQHVIDDLKQQLEAHPVYAAVDSVTALRRFMEHHVFSVWDFMSLVKFVQQQVAPAGAPWLPAQDADVARFINELVLEEETDELPGGSGYISHFELYCMAMEEVGADTAPVKEFLQRVREASLEAALESQAVPSASCEFTRKTFTFIQPGKPHLAAAALALGREHIIPGMFQALLDRAGIDEQQAPVFHYYLKRHISLDEGVHGPLSLRMLNGMCRNAADVAEATAAAQQAVEARITLWDGVMAAIEEQRAAA